jgi:hypothetical protein
MITINQTKIYDGKWISSGVYAKLRALNSSFSIVNCDFQRNEGGHLFVELVRSGIVYIDVSTFNTCDDHGVAISGKPHYVRVILHRSNISNSNISGLLLTNIDHAIIEDCVFANNKDDGLKLRNSY